MTRFYLAITAFLILSACQDDSSAGDDESQSKLSQISEPLPCDTRRCEPLELTIESPAADEVGVLRAAYGKLADWRFVGVASRGDDRELKLAARSVPEGGAVFEGKGILELLIRFVPANSLAAHQKIEIVLRDVSRCRYEQGSNADACELMTSSDGVEAFEVKRVFPIVILN